MKNNIPMQNIFSRATAHLRLKVSTKSVVNATKVLSPILLFAFLTLGFGQAWATWPEISGFGFQFRDESGVWYKTSPDIMNTDLGNKTNLKIVYIYANGDKKNGNICSENSYLKFEVNGTTSTSWTDNTGGACSWSGSTPTWKWGTENGSGAIKSGLDLVANRMPGEYNMQFYFSFNGFRITGNWKSISKSIPMDAS